MEWLPGCICPPCVAWSHILPSPTCPGPKVKRWREEVWAENASPFRERSQLVPAILGKQRCLPKWGAGMGRGVPVLLGRDCWEQ